MELLRAKSKSKSQGRSVSRNITPDLPYRSGSLYTVRSGIVFLLFQWLHQNLNSHKTPGRKSDSWSSWKTMLDVINQVKTSWFYELATRSGSSQQLKLEEEENTRVLRLYYTATQGDDTKSLSLRESPRKTEFPITGGKTGSLLVGGATQSQKWKVITRILHEHLWNLRLTTETWMFLRIVL